MSHEHYDNPLIGRYASEAMCRLWGPERKFRTWRRLWVVLAETEAELGLLDHAGADRPVRGRMSTTLILRPPSATNANCGTM